FWRPCPCTSDTVMPATPRSCSACLTSSTLNGLTTAVTSFTRTPSQKRAAPASSPTPGPHRDPSEGVRPSFAGAHPHQLVDRGRPDLAVTDLAGRRRLGDDLDDVLRVVVGDDDVQPH